ncbi:MAG: type I restriction enzyme HsdR N-terminal domain-containing protein [Planctomycetota bacterium]
MPTVPKRVEERIRESLKQFGPILTAQRDRDVSEADTVTLVKDLLSDMFGYDKYAEVTSEYAIRSTYCDLAVKVEDKLRLLIEVKAIGLTLNEKHIKQAVDYAANQGLDWVALTNGIRWLLFRVSFKKPIGTTLVAEFDLLTADPKADADLERIYLLTREGIVKGAVKEFAEKKEAVSRFLLAALLTTDEDVLNALRREIRKVTDILVPVETIAEVLRAEVVKRETLEGDEAANAARQVARYATKAEKEPAAAPPDVAVTATPTPPTAPTQPQT